MRKIDKSKVKAGDWVRVSARFYPDEDRDYFRTYYLDGEVWEQEEDIIPKEDGRAAGLYVGDLWLPYHETVVVEHCPAGS